MRIALKLTLNITRRKPAPTPEPEGDPGIEQRDTALDAMVIPADQREPRELDVNYRPLSIDSDVFFDRGQTIGFSRRTLPVITTRR